MFSFRQKILISYAVVFILFTTMTFPLVTHIVVTIASNAMEARADELIKKIENAPNDLVLIRRLKELQPQVFFRVSVISDDNQVLYDSHKKHLLGPRFSHEYIADQPEVWEAFASGVGYHEDYSEIDDEKFTNFAKAFDFHGKTYVIRTAFPSKYFSDLKDDLEIGFLGMTIAILLLFCIMTWLIINHFTAPIHKIINAIAPYQEGKQTIIPELQMSSSNPNDEFNKLAMTLNSLSAKIQSHIDNLTRLLEMRKDFIANASHELKTPVTIIHGFAETLCDYPDLPQETRTDIMEKVMRNCRRMTILIKDLLILSDVENIPLSRLHECNLAEIIQTCFLTLQDKFPTATFNLDIPPECDVNVIADPSLMELAMVNLIENAAKYSKAPAHVDVALRREKENLVITIADKGIGIPPEDLEFIFERFYTVDKAHSQKMGGSGLGLSIVQNIINKHFGKISVQSQLGQGTTFTIILPSRKIT